MKFIKEFRGVPDGDIYPVQYVAGDECPPELEAAATASGVLELVKALVPPAPAPEPEPEPEPELASEVAPAAEEEKAKPAKKAGK